MPESNEEQDKTLEDMQKELEAKLSACLQEFFFTPHGQVVKQWLTQVALSRTFTPDETHPLLRKVKLEDVAFEEGKRKLALTMLRLGNVPYKEVRNAGR